MSFLTRRVARRLGPLGVALTIYDVWTRLPKKDRERLIALARKHGTRSLDIVKRQSANVQNRFV